jgi:hypothetical protein
LATFEGDHGNEVLRNLSREPLERRESNQSPGVDGVPPDSMSGGAVLNLARKLRRRARDLFPVEGFHFDRPLVLLQSDDWGRVGLRDRAGLEELRSGGIEIGERPYDFYTLETAEDLSALRALLCRHRDSAGQYASIGMNFIVANLDFARIEADDFRRIHLLPLGEGLPRGWNRPGLHDGYREGVSDGVFHPGLHGVTHFCRPAVERQVAGTGDRRDLLRTLWRAGTPYIHWRMPWVGFEYWDPEQPADERFLTATSQRELVGQSVGAFARFFSAVPRSACAPGYRADEDTHKAWAEYGVRVAQNGPGTFMPPHFDDYNTLHLYRSVEFEPATDPALSVASSLHDIEMCFAHGIPAVVSLHSINFHSSVRDFRSRSLELLNELLSTLETKYPDLLYLHDENLCDLINRGSYENAQGLMRVNVTKKRTSKLVASQRTG